MKDKDDGLESRDGGQGSRGEGRVFQPHGRKELHEQREKVFAHPEVLHVGKDFVCHAEAPKQGPKPQDGSLNQSLAFHRLSSVEM